ncbi:MAG TPA: tripartite tricarboxylate transporter substrate-binding protein, partial [Ramlibacter sp.]|nr:tripartite tricarboxylate transporter substrate-binding protein [Ramlibacter sp.]
PMLTDLLGGQVLASMDAATTSWPQVQAGKLRALGVSTAQRAFFAPDVPAIAETVPGFDVRPWHGVVAPAGTPAAIVEKLSKEIQAFLRQPATEAKLREMGVVRVGSSPAEFSRAMEDEHELYKRLVKQVGIKAD